MRCGRSGDITMWITLITAVCLVGCLAKPHRQNGRDPKFFHDDLVLSPIAVATERDQGETHPHTAPHWMAWQPDSHPDQEPLFRSRDLYDLDDLDSLDTYSNEADLSDPISDLNDPISDLNDPDREPDEPPRPAQPTEHSTPSEIPKDACSGVYCRLGRVCSAGACVCGEASLCEGHSKPVCGTDGQFYTSHCDLHRHACLRKAHIAVDHSHDSCNTEFDDVASVNHHDHHDKSHRHHKDTFKVEERVEVSVQQLTQPEQDKDSDVSQVTSVIADIDDVTSEASVAALPVQSVFCSDEEYAQFKLILMHYHCARIGENDCKPHSKRLPFVANVMFSYYDRSGDALLSFAELSDIEHRDHLDKLSSFCVLTDILSKDDLGQDGNISKNEFFNAFEVSSVVLDENLRTFTTQVATGNSIELKCDIRGATSITWQRNGVHILEDTSRDIRTFDDGSLYISNLALHHMANYTCRDALNPHVIQTHVLKIQLAPQVRISPSTQFHTSGSTVLLKCHAEGVPRPHITWEMNESPLHDDPTSQHYIQRHNNASLEIRDAVYTKDTGAYKCKARNTAGTGQDIATVFIENGKVPQYTTDEDLYEVFVVFHDTGYTVYEPLHCHIKHQVTGEFSMFKLLPDLGSDEATLCAPGQDCSWGEAVNVNNKFLYVTQPKLNRVIVIEIQDRSNPVEVIPVDTTPVSIRYVASVDSVVVVCWGVAGAGRSAVIIRQAAQDQQHHIVHIAPDNTDSQDNTIVDIHVAGVNDLHHVFPHGYVTLAGQQSLHKLHLDELTYTRTTDLSKYDCTPTHVQFIPIGGVVVVSCAAGRLLMLDYVTDTVMSTIDISGVPHVSPDSRYMVVVSDRTDTITVYTISDDGRIEKLYDEYTTVDIADVTFFPAEQGRGYDFYASSVNKNKVLYMNLASGKVEMIDGVGSAMPRSEWPWSGRPRVIVGGGVFGEYLMTPTRESVVVLDGRRRHVQCEWRDIQHGNVIVWVDPTL